MLKSSNVFTDNIMMEAITVINSTTNSLVTESYIHQQMQIGHMQAN